MIVMKNDTQGMHTFICLKIYVNEIVQGNCEYMQALHLLIEDASIEVAQDMIVKRKPRNVTKPFAFKLFTL